MKVKLLHDTPVTVVSGPAVIQHVTFIDLIRVAYQGVNAENVRWIRGHHALDSDQVKALLAAWALSR